LREDSRENLALLSCATMSNEDSNSSPSAFSLTFVRNRVAGASES
jgi:hypothetical protein